MKQARPSDARTRPRRHWRIVERNAVAYRRLWVVFVSGFAEPLLFLLSIGIGVGSLVGPIPFKHHLVSYRAFAAPALLASSAMNGAVIDTTFNFFAKFKYANTYDAMLSTPVGVRDVAAGEALWAVLRGATYSAVFLLTMWILGIVTTWWAVLALPGAVMIAYAFAGAGLAATTWMRSWVDFDLVLMVTVPSFLFSATFFPLSRYPGAMALVVRLTPLYQGVAFERAACLGRPDAAMGGHALYLIGVGTAGVFIAGRRLAGLLQP